MKISSYQTALKLFSFNYLNKISKCFNKFYLKDFPIQIMSKKFLLMAINKIYLYKNNIIYYKQLPLQYSERIF